MGIAKLLVCLHFLLLFSSLSAQSNVSETLKKTLLDTCKAAEIVTTFVVTHMGLLLIHEAAHVLTAHLAKSSGAKIISEPTLALEPFNYGCIPTGTYPIFENKIINVLITAIAPTLGLAGIYGILKADNIACEYLKDYNFKRAFKDGMKKDLINKDQHIGIRAAALVHLIHEGLMLLPVKIKDSETHGYQILKDLNLLRENNNS